MKLEYSAGGVVFREDRTLIKVLLAQHSQHHGWVFPKGIIGDVHVDESKEETAVREVEEETGVLGAIIQPITPVTYRYKWGKEEREKTVYYFVMRYVSEDLGKKDNEMEHVEWLRLDTVHERLMYPSDKKVWEEAREIIEAMANS